MARTHTDLSRVPISVAPDPATSGTSLGVTDANAAYLPDTYPYWAVCVPTGAAPTRSNSEIVKVTAGSSSGGTTTLTIVRAQGIPVTTAQSITTSFDIYDANSAEANLGPKLEYQGYISTTYNASTGNASYTGVGFQPTSVQFIGISIGSTCSGYMTASTQFCAMSSHYDAYTTTDITTSYAVYMSNASGTNRQAAYVSMDADGFTLNWSKVGSPTGNFYLHFIARR